MPKFRTLFPVKTAVHLLHCSIFTLYCTAVHLHFTVPQYIYIVLYAVHLHNTVPQYIYIVLYRSIFTLYCTAVNLHCTVPQYIYIVLYRSTFTFYCIAEHLHCTVLQYIYILLYRRTFTLYCTAVNFWISVKPTLPQPVLYQYTKIKTQNCHILCSYNFLVIMKNKNIHYLHFIYKYNFHGLKCTVI